MPNIIDLHIAMSLFIRISCSVGTVSIATYAVMYRYSIPWMVLLRLLKGMVRRLVISTSDCPPLSNVG